MQLSSKATRFVIEALEHYRKSLDARIQQKELPEDEASDLINDREFLLAIKQDLQEYQDNLSCDRSGTIGYEASPPLPREV